VRIAQLQKPAGLLPFSCPKQGSPTTRMLRCGCSWQRPYLAGQEPRQATGAAYKTLLSEVKIQCPVGISCRTCRSAFQRAVVVPTASAQALWSAYEQSELGGEAKALGRRALDDMRPRNAAAKSAYATRQRHLTGLDPDALALLPGGGPTPIVSRDW